MSQRMASKVSGRPRSSTSMTGFPCRARHRPTSGSDLARDRAGSRIASTFWAARGMFAMAKVVFIVSGATYWVLKDGTRYATGYWAEEFANPYKILTDAGHEVVVGTPNGVTPNVDMMSLRPEMAGGVQGALDLEAIIRSAEVMRRPLKVSDVRP